MEWLTRLLGKVASEDMVDMIVLNSGDFGPKGNPIAVDECYVELFVNSLRLEKARRFGTKFHGVVYTYPSFAYEGGASATLPAISKPKNLEAVDPEGMGNVITLNRKMMGSVPWRGGTFALELGLFSVKGGNLLSSVLDYLVDLSSTAGASFVGAAKPFVPLVSKGMDMLAGQTSEVALEVGIDTSVPMEREGTYAIIAKPKSSSIDISRITLDPSDQKLLYNGKPLIAAYCVYSIKRVDQKADFGEIPELKDAWTKMREAIRTYNRQDAEGKFTAFRLAALTSPDLTRKDADGLVARAQQTLEAAFPTTLAGDTRGEMETSPEPLAWESLSDVPLYRPA
jgi:hypothetical protein